MAEAKLTVGNVEILVMHDAESALPLEMTFPHVTAQDWVPFKEKYPEAFDGPDNLRAHFECYLIPSQGQTILVDTGSAPMIPIQAPSRDCWAAALRENYYPNLLPPESRQATST